MEAFQDEQNYAIDCLTFYKTIYSTLRDPSPSHCHPIANTISGMNNPFFSNHDDFDAKKLYFLIADIGEDISPPPTTGWPPWEDYQKFIFEEKLPLTCALRQKQQDEAEVIQDEYFHSRSNTDETTFQIIYFSQDPVLDSEHRERETALLSDDEPELGTSPPSDYSPCNLIIVDTHEEDEEKELSHEKDSDTLWTPDHPT